jgi:hypothetical protein
LKRVVIAAITALCLAAGFRFLTRPVQVVSRQAPDCSVDGGRRIITQVMAVCLPPDTYATARQDGRGTDFLIAGLGAPLSALSGPSIPRVEKDEMVWPALLSVNGEPVVKRSNCGGFTVMDATWKSISGMRARQLVDMGTSIGYGWTRDGVAQNFDRVLDTWTCRDDLVTGH